MQEFRNTKLVNLIDKLSKKDFNKLIPFLNCRYLNSNKELPAFLKAIWKYHSNFTHKNFTAENIYKKIYPGEHFNENKFRRLKTDLVNRILYFLAIEELEKEKHLNEKLAYKGLSRIGYYRAFLIAAEASIQKIEKKNKTMNLQDILDLQGTNHDLFFHPETIQEGDLAEGYINASMDYLDNFYFFAKITYSLQLLSRGKVLRKKYNIKLLDQAMKAAKQTALKDNVLFNLYLLAVKLLKSGKEDNFVVLKSYLFEYATEIPKEEKNIGAVILINFAIAQRNKGNEPYLKELFELYKFRDKEDVFLHKGSIAGHPFTNVVITAAVCGEFKWAEYFMEKYAKFIKEDMREDALKLSRAFLHFHQKDYGEVLKLLATIDRNDFNTSIRIRSLYIRTYYELSLSDHTYDEMARKEITNMRAYLRNNSGKFSKKKIKAYSNFCVVSLAIINKKSKAVINGKIQKLKPLKFRIWLQEKSDALK